MSLYKQVFISGSVSMPKTKGFPQVLLQIQLFWGSNGGLGKRKKKKCPKQSVIITLKMYLFTVNVSVMATVLMVQ